MDPITLAIIVMLAMFALLAIGLPIGFAMAVTGFIGSTFLIDLDAALSLLGQTAYETTITFNLSVVPLFILMGYFASNSGLSEGLFRACNTWLGYRRGGLGLATNCRLRSIGCCMRIKSRNSGHHDPSRFARNEKVQLQ